MSGNRYDCINQTILKWMARVGSYAAEKYGAWDQYTKARLDSRAAQAEPHAAAATAPPPPRVGDVVASDSARELAAIAIKRPQSASTRDQLIEWCGQIWPVTRGRQDVFDAAVERGFELGTDALLAELEKRRLHVEKLCEALRKIADPDPWFGSTGIKDAQAVARAALAAEPRWRGRSRGSPGRLGAPTT